MPPQLVVADDRYGNRDEYREHSSGRGFKPIAPALSRGRGGRWWLSIHDCREVRSGYLFGTYRIATAPEPNSTRLISFSSSRFDKPANKVGPCPATIGCTTNSYSSINPSSA